MSNYNHIEIEQKWQKFWDKNKTFSVKNSPHPDSLPKGEGKMQLPPSPSGRGVGGEGKNFYALDMFPFPSGAGLHVGHPEGYTATDILCRKRRMEGFKVLHPMGWDAFGLPAENFAIKSKIHPEISTNKNIENFTRQIKSLGFSYDWDREISTTDTDYYKWTQDLFLKFYETGLLYEDDKPMNWCPTCKVICANEEVEQGMHERCGNAVSKKALKQWMFKITDYAERLLQDMETPNVMVLHGWGGNGESGWGADIKKYFSDKNIECETPSFPNTNTPEYSEWKAFFEKNLLKKITPQTIIFAHSLGGGFIQRYLTEENLNVKFSELILVAPTVGDCGIPEIKNFFTEEIGTKKKRGCVPLGCCSKDNMAKPSQSDFIFSDSLAKVKKKTFKKTKKLAHIKTIVKNNNISVIFDGEILFSHFLSKPYKERNFRQSWALTIIKAISYMNIIDNIAYIESQNQIFKVVFSQIDKKTSQIKTFYRSEKLTEKYQEYIKREQTETIAKKFDYQKISGAVENIFVYAGGKDPYIKKEEFEFLAEKLSAQLIFNENQEHYFGDQKLKDLPEISEKCEKISESTLDWPHKIKAMQKNWIGKSSGLLFTSPLIVKYIKRGTNSHKGGHLDQNESGNNRRSSQSISIVLSKIPKVKKRKIRENIENIQVSHDNFVFDGFKLRQHWEGKSSDEIKFREEFSLTVLKNLKNLHYISEEIGVFHEREKVFLIFFEILKSGEKRVITYFKSHQLSKAYQHAKKTNTLEIQTYNSHFEAFKADTFFVIAPDHPQLESFVEGEKNKAEILAECKAIVSRRDARGFEEEKESEGIFTGRYIQDPVGNGKLPLWVASYALADYGTGIVKCSCHDERDFAFAKKYNIPMKPVLFPENSEEAKKVKNLEYCYTDMKKGILTEPVEFSGQVAGKLRKKISEYTEKNNLAKEETNYKLRDWIFTRQRYWGEPIPLIHCKKCGTQPVSPLLKYQDEYFQAQKKNVGASNQLKSKDNACVTDPCRSTPRALTPKSVSILGENFLLCKEKSNRLFSRVKDFIKAAETIENPTEKVFVKWRWVYRHFLLKEDPITYASINIRAPYRDVAIEAISQYNFSEKKDNYTLYALDGKGTILKIILTRRDGKLSLTTFYPLKKETKKIEKYLPHNALPLILPETPNYEPSATGESPLAKIESWVHVKCPCCGETAQRETSTMPNWAGSSWYWLRFMDPKNQNEAWSMQAEKQWGAVDLYVGGAEHAVLHLLYARFWHKALFDMGLVSTKEPFKKLVNQGMILSYAFEKQTAGGGLVAVDEVTENPENSGNYFWKNPETGETQAVKKITAKMSKSLKNVVNPDDIVEEFGADTLRMYEMFMGPFEQSKEWNTKAVEGMHKFLARIYRYFSEKEISESCPSKALISLTHKTVKKVSEDIEAFKFNTAISQMMVWMNEFSKLDTIPKISGGKFVRLLAPFAPHLAEELWKKFKPESETLTFENWPSYQEELTVDAEMTYGVQVNGKVRGELTISKDAPKDECLAKAKELEKVKNFLEMGEIKKEIFVPGKIIGFVVK